MHSEEDKLSAEDKKRRLKTPSQVAALEEFYNEHKYPSEEMKSEFASRLGLTEKQISRWFCHRRLKDKNRLKDDACMSGKHDLSNSVLQDRGSGLRQDSCGSTKQGDYMHFDPREVESRRFFRQDYPSAALASENRGQDKRTKDYGTVSDTSSGSSSGPQDRLLPSRYSSWDSNSMLMNTKGVKGRGYMMASEYLYLQDEIENPAISAVKKQLGRRYRPDGPPIGLEFQPLPPGAFDAPLGDSIQEPYYVGDPSLQNSYSISRVKKENSAGMAHGIHRYKSYPHGSCTEGSGFRRTVWESDHQKESISYPSSQRSFTNYYYHGPDKNSVLEMDADSAAEASVFKSNSVRISSKQRVEQTSISSKGSLRLYDRNINPNESHYSQLRNDDIGSHEFKTREYFQLGASNSVLHHSEPHDADDKFNSRKLTKLEQRYLEKRVNEHKTISNPLRTKTLRQEMKMGKQLKGTEFPRLDSTLRTPSQEQPWKKPIKGFAGELPTSFSEDETASSSSSMDC
ncbi:hypothetical protein AAC387_Pa02g4452 [Persea americana]